jgi:hypothetical protein
MTILDGNNCGFCLLDIYCSVKRQSRLNRLLHATIIDRLRQEANVRCKVAGLEQITFDICRQSLPFLALTGSMPGKAASMKEACELGGPAKLVDAPLKSLRSEIICACTSIPVGVGDETYARY